MIKTVTITGADNTIDPSDLVKLSQDFPFVEWGILLSRKRMGESRYPSFTWMVDLHSCTEMYPFLKLSCHLCGAYVREFIKGDVAFVEREIGADKWNMFQRVQLNFHGIKHEHAEVLYALIRKSGKEFIFQHDDVNQQIAFDAARRSHNVSILFDKSGGAGILPDKWPELLPDIKCGYAGGLGPDNLKSQIELIEGIVGDTSIWIDMETKVRSFTAGVQTNVTKDIFDLDKVRQCLEIAKPFIQ